MRQLGIILKIRLVDLYLEKQILTYRKKKNSLRITKKPSLRPLVKLEIWWLLPKEN